MAAKSSGTPPDKRRKYDEAFKAEALRLASESRSTQAAARQLGISPKLLYRWQQAQLVAEVGSVEVARDPEVRALRAANKRLAQEVDILKKSLGHLRPADLVSTYRYIAQRQAQVAVRHLCQMLQVAPSAYYAWRHQCQLPVAGPAWQAAVRAAFDHHAQRYGTRRLRAEVQAQGHRVGRWRIRRVLLKAHGLRAQRPRSFAPRTTDSDPAVRAAPNRLLGQPAPTAPNRVWVGDITYLPRQGGWLYLAVWLDRCSRKIVGWDVRDTMPEDLVSEALRRALAVRRPPAGLIVHSDQSSQYTATRLKDLVAQHGAQQSMSRRGNCYDNAHAESFWSRFKAELLDSGSFPGLTEARLEISHHIAYYNAERRHLALGYLAPNHFETYLQPTSQLCPA